MRHTTEPAESRTVVKRVLYTLAAIALVFTVALGLHGLFFTPHQATPTTTRAATSAHPPAAASSPSPDVSNDPRAFARQIASILFDWNTTTDTPAAITQKLIALGDPTGNELDGLASDIRAYLPDPTAWQALQKYDTTQSLAVMSVAVPSTWDQVKAAANPGQILPGTTAFTVTGTRRRTGSVGGQPSNVTDPVAFTMFVTCTPSFPACHVMRLGQLNTPMK